MRQRRKSEIHRNTEEKNISDPPKWYPYFFISEAWSRQSRFREGRWRAETPVHISPSPSPPFPTHRHILGADWFKIAGETGGEGGIEGRGGALWGKVSRTKGLRERLTFHVFLQLGKIIGAYQAPLLGHLSCFLKDGHKGSLAVILMAPGRPLPRVGLEDDKSMWLREPA